MEGFIEGSADGVPMFVTDVDSQDILQRNVHSQPPAVGQLQWHQYRGHFQLVEVRIKGGHPIEVLLLPVDLVY